MQPASVPVQFSTRSSLSALTVAIGLFRELRHEMPHLPLVFLLIAQHKGISAAKLGELTGFSQSSISRNIAALTKEGRDGEPGLGLVIKTLDPVNTRAHAMYLSKAGRAFAARLADALGKSMKPLKAVPVLPAEPREAALGRVPDAFAGAHWEVWAD